jgi:hypothetical protein
MIHLLAHRGAWQRDGDKNAMSALCGALDQGFGIETDVRDLDGELVISHDAPRAGFARPLSELFAYYVRGGFSATLALNIKSDGLQEPLDALIQEYGIRHYFVFDMSVPDTLGYLRRGMPVYVRRSELEDYSALAHEAAGIWLDELTRPWVDATAIAVASAAPRVAIVSPELHRREHTAQWQAIASALAHGVAPDKLLLCTDFPQDARRYFA